MPNRSQVPTFKSFIAAGFECTYALAENKRRLDMLGATKHDKYCRADYQLIRQIGIKTVREGFAWSQIDQGNNQYDFSRFEQVLRIGQEQGIQQIWDLNHFDYPEYLDPFNQQFIQQFAEYARRVIHLVRQYQTGTLYIVPVNEISFFAWIGADMGWWAPYAKGREKGFTFKQQLVKAAIAAMDAIWQEDRDVRFIQVDPFMRRLATSPASKKAKEHVREFNEVVRYEAWDMLCGKKLPEIGGDPKYLDIIGVNYYIHNQEWVISGKGQGAQLKHQLMDWESSDRVSFAQMLNDIYQRYGRPLYISETGSYGPHREQWWLRVLAQIEEGLQQELPICGVCAYPTVDRPESAGFLLPESGLWDFACDDLSCQRIPHQASLDIIARFQEKWAKSPTVSKN